MYLLFNYNVDKIFINWSTNDNFWKKFLNFGGKHYKDGKEWIKDSNCGGRVEFEYPTLYYLKQNNVILNIQKLYKLAYSIINKISLENFILPEKNISNNEDYNKMNNQDKKFEECSKMQDKIFKRRTAKKFQEKKSKCIECDFKLQKIKKDIYKCSL